MPYQPTRLGLTGGIGSGKSTVARMFASLGAAVIDADAVSRSLTAPQGKAIEAIRLEFGDTMISAEGSLDRHRMRNLIFTNASAKNRLENIVHPLIQFEIQQQDQAWSKVGVDLIVYDIPLLVESNNWRPMLDQVLVIDCLEQTQIDRVILRNTLKKEDVEKIMANQASRKMRNHAADMLIFNDSITIEQLREHVVQISQHFKRPFDERKKL
jgi:dephospho-CoA kinase